MHWASGTGPGGKRARVGPSPGFARGIRRGAWRLLPRLGPGLTPQTPLAPAGTDVLQEGEASRGKGAGTSPFREGQADLDAFPVPAFFTSLLHAWVEEEERNGAELARLADTLEFRRSYLTSILSMALGRNYNYF